MTGWWQAVFIRQRRIDVIQRALSKVLAEESWSSATPRRLHVGSADASSRGWTMVVPELANFFLDRGGTAAPRLCRLAHELRCPAYEVDVRGQVATTLFEVDALGRMRISGSRMALIPGLSGLSDFAGKTSNAGDADQTDLDVASDVVGFGLLPITDDIRDRIAMLDGKQPLALADYLGALAGFPAWTQHGDDASAAGELIYEPPRIVTSARAGVHGRTRRLTARPPETREASGRMTPRAAPPAHDRRGRLPRSAARPRR